MAEKQPHELEIERRKMAEEMRKIQAETKAKEQAMRSKMHELPGQIKAGAHKGRSIFILVALIGMIILILYYLSFFKK